MAYNFDMFIFSFTHKILILFLVLFSFRSVFSQELPLKSSAIKKIERIEKLKQTPWSKYYAYVPEKTEFNFELGSMAEANNLYWLGGSMGFHIGRCMFSQSQTCQQFADFIGGAGGRSGFTNGVLLSSLRWQFIDLKSKFVTHARVLAGAINHRDEERNRTVFAYGVGYGITTSIHERLDLKFEIRGGYGDKAWSQSFVSLSIKFDKFVTYFAKKLDRLGMAGRLVKGTAELTGKIIKGTVETTGKVLQGTIKTTTDVLDEGSQKAKGLIYTDKTKKEEPKP